MPGMQERLVLGDTLNFTTTVPDYPADESWTLKYRLVPTVSGSAIEITSSADTDNPELHRVQVPASTTSVWTAGSYTWFSYVEKAAESYSLGNGQITLLPNPRTASAPLDLRTDAAIALAQAKAALAAWTPTTKSYTIGGRQMVFNTPAEIVQVINYWTAEVKREENAAALASGMASKRRVMVRAARA